MGLEFWFILVLIVGVVIWVMREDQKTRVAEAVVTGINLHRIVVLLQEASRRDIFLHFGVSKENAKDITIIGGKVRFAAIEPPDATVFITEGVHFKVSQMRWLTTEVPDPNNRLLVSWMTRHPGFMVPEDWMIYQSPLVRSVGMYQAMLDEICAYPLRHNDGQE